MAHLNALIFQVKMNVLFLTDRVAGSQRERVPCHFAQIERVMWCCIAMLHSVSLL